MHIEGKNRQKHVPTEAHIINSAMLNKACECFLRHIANDHFYHFPPMFQQGIVYLIDLQINLSPSSDTNRLEYSSIAVLHKNHLGNETTSSDYQTMYSLLLIDEENLQVRSILSGYDLQS